MKAEEALRQLGKTTPEPPEPNEACPELETLRQFQREQLEATPHAAVEAHLAQCARCVDILVTLDQPTPRMSRGTTRRVLAATTPERAPQRRALNQWALGGIVSAAAALLLVVLVTPGTHAPVPPYDLVLSGQIMEVRGENTDTRDALPTYNSESDLLFRVMPELGQAQERPEICAYLRDEQDGEQGSYHLVQPPPELAFDSSTGLIEARIRVGLLLGDQYGVHALLLVLFPHGSEVPKTIASEQAIPKGARAFKRSIAYQPL